MTRRQIELSYRDLAVRYDEAIKQAKYLSSQSKVDVLVRLQNFSFYVKHNEENNLGTSLSDSGRDFADFTPTTDGALAIAYFPVYNPDLNTRAIIVTAYQLLGDKNAALSLEQWKEAVEEIKGKLGASKDRRFGVFWDVVLGEAPLPAVKESLADVVDGLACHVTRISRSLSGSFIEFSWEVYENIGKYQKPGGKISTNYSLNCVQKNVEDLACWLKPHQF